MNQNESLLPLKIAVLTVSDTRTEADDKSGKILVDNLTTTGHSLFSLGLWLAWLTELISFVCLVLAVLVRQDGVSLKTNLILATVLVIWLN